MEEISLKKLLEAGCHFGHKVEKWNPKASDYIYQTREGIHIIDLAQTRDRLKKAAEFVNELGKEGKNFLLVATKRQARGVVTEAAKRSNLPFMTTRWIGGFMTNWEEVNKNIEKLKTMSREKEEGKWSEFPKHEQVKLDKELRKLKLVYDGVALLESLPDAIFIVDVKKEDTAVREAKRRNITSIAIVDTNCDPYTVDYPIPANDDAVGSIQYIINYLVSAYLEGQKIGEKEGKAEKKKVESHKAPAQTLGKKVEKEEKVKQTMEKKKKVAKKEKEKKEKKKEEKAQEEKKKEEKPDRRRMMKNSK